MPNNWTGHPLQMTVERARMMDPIQMANEQLVDESDKVEEK